MLSDTTQGDELMDIINTFSIAAPVDTTWQLLGEEFGEVSGWA
jgi:hypothetical protein